MMPASTVPPVLTVPKTITPAERAWRKHNPSTPMPKAQFRKKGCKSCKPIPAPTRQVPFTSPTSTTPEAETVLDASNALV